MILALIVDGAGGRSAAVLVTAAIFYQNLGSHGVRVEIDPHIDVALK